MIYITDSFWYLEVPESHRRNPHTAPVHDVADFIRKDFGARVKVKRPNSQVYSLDFADTRCETLFKIKYSEYVRSYEWRGN